MDKRLCKGSFAAKSDYERRNRVEAQWWLWRLVLDGKLDYNTVFHQMTEDEALEANIALDMYIEMMKAE